MQLPEVGTQNLVGEPFGWMQLYPVPQSAAVLQLCEQNCCTVPMVPPPFGVSGTYSSLRTHRPPVAQLLSSPQGAHRPPPLTVPHGTLRWPTTMHCGFSQHCGAYENG